MCFFKELFPVRSLQSLNNYQNLTLANLRKVAKDYNIKSIYKYNKKELLEIISAYEKNSSSNSEESPKNKFKSANSREIPPETKEISKNPGASESESKPTGSGILEILPDGYGFLRGENYLSSDEDVYISQVQIKRFHMKTGDYIEGLIRPPKNTDKFPAILYVNTINGETPDKSIHRNNFANLVPIFPQEKFALNKSSDISIKILDIIAPIGKGQRGLIVAPPKAGKTTLLKSIAKTIKTFNPECEIIILLIDERPEEVTDIKTFLPDIDVAASTFDEEPENHIKVTEMVLNRGKNLVEFGKDAVILLDSITRLARAYNLTCDSSGKILSGGLDPASVHGPKRFFGAARNIKGNGSLTIIGTCLVDTGSKMDDLIYEEFKGTGNMELVLERKLAEKRIFPAFNIQKSGTRKDELLQGEYEYKFARLLRKNIDKLQSEETINYLKKLLSKTDNYQNMIKILNRNS